MKPSPLLWIFVFMLSAGAEGRDQPLVEVGQRVDVGTRTVVEFKLPREVFDKIPAKIIHWSPGDPDLVSLEKLVKIAAAEARPPKDGDGYKYNRDPDLMGIDWRRLDSTLWHAEFHFMYSVASEPGKIGVRDGQVFVSVYLLPDGYPITAVIRPMTQKEMVDFGVVTPTDEEIRERRKKMGPDPFAPKSSK